MPRASTVYAVTAIGIAWARTHSDITSVSKAPNERRIETPPMLRCAGIKAAKLPHLPRRRSMRRVVHVRHAPNRAVPVVGKQ